MFLPACKDWLKKELSKAKNPHQNPKTPHNWKQEKSQDNIQ